MTIYYMGGEMPSIIPSDSTTTEYLVAFDPAFSRAAVAMGFGGPAAFGETPELGLPDDFFVHGYFLRGTTGTAEMRILVLATATTEVLQVVATDTTIKIQRWNGSAWVDVGSAVAFSGNSENHIDLEVVGNDASGTVKLYIGGTERISETADLSAVVNIEHLRAYGVVGAARPTYWSQIIVADEPTIGWRLATNYPNGTGATADWTGGSTDIDEAVLSDADFINTSTADAVELVTQTGPSLTGYVVRAVGVYARAKRGSTGPQNLQLALRSGGTVYTSGTKALGLGYSAYGHIWETNPATGAAWVNTAISALQPGVKAIT